MAAQTTLGKLRPGDVVVSGFYGNEYLAAGPRRVLRIDQARARGYFVLEIEDRNGKRGTTSGHGSMPVSVEEDGR